MSTPDDSGDLEVLGWREWVGLPDLSIGRIKAKVDTGARTSALHAFEVDDVDVDGAHWIEFAVHPLQRRNKPVVRCRAPVIDERVVRDSGGHEEMRYVIGTDVEIGSRRFPIEITLTDRDNMGFRMLLGRRALDGRYVVDTSRAYTKGKRR